MYYLGCLLYYVGDPYCGVSLYMYYAEMMWEVTPVLCGGDPVLWGDPVLYGMTLAIFGGDLCIVGVTPILILLQPGPLSVAGPRAELTGSNSHHCWECPACCSPILRPPEADVGGTSGGERRVVHC